VPFVHPLPFAVFDALRCPTYPLKPAWVRISPRVRFRRSPVMPKRGCSAESHVVNGVRLRLAG
jgi:hypothetical protein